MPDPLVIRRYRDSDHQQARQLFIDVNRLLAPAHLKAAFESYIARSLAEEIDIIEDYYRRHSGSFWVCEMATEIVGMMGLERHGDDDLELRRMYVDPDRRRQGIAAQMLDFAEAQSRREGATRLFLSTSELQQAALAFYRARGYLLLREEVADASSNKTIGGGIRRYYFAKSLT
ncbi:MAG: GNAT family N-acetyltransferase [Rhodospirillales bacterium]|nr:GNAT family N-acetyltransferase [Rhodospirillales bacterium]